MKTLIVRSLSGAVFAALIIGSILYSPMAYLGLSVVFATLIVNEYYRMFAAGGVKPLVFPGLFLSLLFLILLGLSMLEYIGMDFIFPMAALMLVLPVLELYRQHERPAQNMAATWFPLVAVSLPFGLSMKIYTLFPEGGAYVLMGFFLLMWAFDSFAYLVGVSIGRHRLFERISPKKSWEGFAGGLVLSVGVAYLLSLYFTVLSPLQWMVMSLIISVTGTYGDLSESMIKRSFDVKDSGKVMPGHGGMLDRFDAALMALPFVLCYLYFIS